jgi:hypothetical protein
LALATVVGALSVGVASPAFATGTVTALSVDKTSVASLETFTISSTGTDWTGCVAKIDPGETIDQFPYDANYDISNVFGQKTSWNGYGTASGLPGIYSIRLYSGSCASITQGVTTPAFEITVNVAPVNGAGTVDVTLYQTYDSSTLEATPYTYPTMAGSFDGSFSGWHEVTYDVAGTCGAGITGLPAGVTVDATYSPGGGVAPLLKFSGTPAAGSKGTYTTCLDLYDGDTICEDSYWIATVVVSDGVPPAPKLANTGVDQSQATATGVVAAGILALGALLVIAYRRRLGAVVTRKQ